LDLYQFIKQKNLELDERARASIFRDIIEGVHFLHAELGIIHRDIKLENIMINQKTTSKEMEFIPIIIDFGLSKLHFEGEETRNQCGTLAYCSPEII